MGFGTLLVGYLFLLVTIPFFGGFDLHFIGYGVMYVGLLSLIPYEEKFIPAKKVIWLLLPLSALITGAYLLNYFGLPLFSETVLSVLEMVRRVLLILYHYFLLFAMRHLAKDVGQEKIAGKCLRNFCIFTAYLLCMIVLNLPVSAVDAFKNEYRQIVVLFDLVWILLLALNSLQIYSCYLRICPEGEEDLPMKEGKIERFFREKLEKKLDPSESEEVSSAAEAKKPDHPDKKKKKKKK